MTADRPARTRKPIPATGWLEISQDGFAAMNRERPPGHLAKELVQNALDAVNGNPEAEIHLSMSHQSGTFHLRCTDNGAGIPDLTRIRMVYWTSKTDDHMVRGRMGRGFKEILCLAQSGIVESLGKRITFLRNDAGDPLPPQISSVTTSDRGTAVQLYLPWGEEEVYGLAVYFNQFLVPPHVKLHVNGETVTHREPKHCVECRLPTEIFDFGTSSWKKPMRATQVHLVPTKDGEEPFLYEMGIPVCPTGWKVRYHADVQQRVPMNPNRDAVATGYDRRLHQACLPTLLPEMTQDQVLDDAVGAVAPELPEDVQKVLIEKGFGQICNLARSVPDMGRFSPDEDVRDLGKTVIDTRNTSAGFREILRTHVPTSREVVKEDQARRATAAAQTGIPADRVERFTSLAELVAAVGGAGHVKHVCQFARWFCAQMLSLAERDATVVVHVADLEAANASATWSAEDALSLGLNDARIWKEPISPYFIGLLVHEAAHHNALHHGHSFHEEVEYLSGFAAMVMFEHATAIRDSYRELL